MNKDNDTRMKHIEERKEEARQQKTKHVRLHKLTNKQVAVLTSTTYLANNKTALYKP